MYNRRRKIKYLDHFLVCPQISWTKHNEICTGGKKK